MASVRRARRDLFPEKVDAHPGHRVKDKLENKLHDLVYGREAHAPDRASAHRANWQKLYEDVYGVAPTG